MSLPFFYTDQLYASQKQIALDEDTSRHIAQVLRMKPGEKVQLTDGKGTLATGHLAESHKKHSTVNIDQSATQPARTRKVTIGISLIKNTSRFEWFLEKAVEIGVHEIIPLLCERTVKEKFRLDRMQGICVSAMLQSQQCWLPVLHEPIACELLFRQQEIADIPQRYIAHCLDGDKISLGRTGDRSIVLIGPEGDFSPGEIDLALQNRFKPVSLGETRLRTETAGVAAAVLLCL